jgi:hypothetical protein
MTESLQLANNLDHVDHYEQRDNEYYGKYKYRARVFVRGFSRGYYFSPDEFEKRLHENRLWGKIGVEERNLINTNLPSIRKMLQFKLDSKKDKTVSVRCEGNIMAVFHNDLAYLHQTFDNLPNSDVDYTEVISSPVTGIKTFVNEPKYKYRVYLKSKKVPDDFPERVRKMVNSNKDLRLSPAFYRWITPEYQRGRGWWATHYYLSSHYFIDYNDESYKTYFALMFDNYIGKYYKLEKRVVSA